MQFLQPLFLLAFTALAIPIAIHLFNFRKYRKVYFTNVRFLAELQQESKKQSNLKRLLILAARLLALAALVMAFSQPYIPLHSQQRTSAAQQMVSIYIDNSWSIEAVSPDGKLIDVARTRAAEITAAYPRSALFQLVTNDFEGRHQAFTSREEFLSMLNEVSLSPVTRPLSEVILRQSNQFLEKKSHSCDAYLVSDFQKSTFSLPGQQPDTSARWFLVPVEAAKRNNLFIDTVYFDSPVHQPGQSVRLIVRIRNSGSEPLEKIPVRLVINGVQKAVGSVSVGNDAFSDITLPYTENGTGIQYGELQVTDFPVTYDDKFYFSYPIRPDINVLCINGRNENQFVNAVYGGDPAFSYTTIPVRQIDFSSLNKWSLILLNEPELSSGLIRELTRFVGSGGSVVAFPPVSGSQDMSGLLAAMQAPFLGKADSAAQRVAWVNTESLLFGDIFEKGSEGKVILPENVDLPAVSRHYPVTSSGSSSYEALLKLDNGDPFLVRTRPGRGNFYLFAAPADESWTSFPAHMLFVPVLYKIALLSNPWQPLSYYLGDPAPVEVPFDSVPEKNIFRIASLDRSYEMIPEIRTEGSATYLFASGHLRDAGLYNVLAGKSVLRGVGFNFNRKESDLSCLSGKEIENQIIRHGLDHFHIFSESNTPLTRQIELMNQGTPLWKWFILASLLFMAIEILLIRKMKE